MDRKKVTIAELWEKKEKAKKISVMTAYDFSTAGLVDQAGMDAVLVGDFPQCVNGFIIASAEGYETKRHLVSSVSEESVSIIMNREYEVELEVQEGSQEVEGYAIVTFTKEGDQKTISYPEQKDNLFHLSFRLNILPVMSLPVIRNPLQIRLQPRLIPVPERAIAVEDFYQDTCHHDPVPAIGRNYPRFAIMQGYQTC